MDAIEFVRLETIRLNKAFNGDRNGGTSKDQGGQLTAALREQFVELFHRAEQAYDLQTSDIRRFADQHKLAAPKCGGWATQMVVERPDFAAVTSAMAAAPLGSDPKDKLKVQGALTAAVLSVLSSVTNGVNVAGGCVIEEVGSRFPARSGTLPGPAVPLQGAP